MNSPRWVAGVRLPLPSGGGIVLIGLSVILLYQVAVPLGLIIWTSLKTIRPGETGFLDFSFTLANYSRAYGIGEFWRASVNTLYFALATTVLAFIWGTFLAWTVERTNTPLARLIGLVTLGRIIIPGVIITVSWILMASPSIGILNHLIAALTGVSRFLNIYSFWGMVWVQALEMTPLAYLLMSAALQSIDPRLEEASAIAGAGTWPTFRRISLPLVLPAARGGGVVIVYPNRGELRGAAVARRPRAGVGLHDASLLQHFAHADGLGIVEHLFDDVAAVGDGVALRLLQTRAPRRALPNHYRQGLPAAPR